jgi:hypothetical protein
VTNQMSVACPGCGLRTEVAEGPTHAYIGASAGCWARYGELLAHGIGGQLAVDTYAVQHPGVEQRRAGQSVAVHLMSICAALERGSPAHRAVPLIRRALASRPAWPWLPLETPVGSVTVVDVLDGSSSVDDWARDVWGAWQVHHQTVRAWLDAVDR